jgi:hypothetical protein
MSVARAQAVSGRTPFRATGTRSKTVLEFRKIALDLETSTCSHVRWNSSWGGLVVSHSAQATGPLSFFARVTSGL